MRRARRRVEGAGWVSPYTDYCNIYEHLALKFARNAECGPRPAHRQATALPIRHAKMQEKHAYSTLYSDYAVKKMCYMCVRLRYTLKDETPIFSLIVVQL